VDPAATCFCLSGAYRAVRGEVDWSYHIDTKDKNNYDLAIDMIMKHARLKTGRRLLSVPEFNDRDDVEYEDVMAVLDAAIDEAEMMELAS
jgi:hypothetical protein